MLTEKTETEGNEVCLKVRRENPQAQRPAYYQDYIVPLGDEKLSLLQALEYVYENLDDTLAFRRYCCGIQFCNSCLMFVDGKRTHACLYILKPDSQLNIEPLPGGRVLRDLITESADFDEGGEPEPGLPD